MTSTARSTLNMRINPDDLRLFDWAAKAQGKTRTDFVLEAARRAARDSMLDSHFVQVSAQAYEEFLARLDAPVVPNERLSKTMQVKAPWE
jgi:uncharacterized protein (DUF1778 family)